MTDNLWDDDNHGVESIHEDNGHVTARDVETGVASFGETKVESLRMLTEALELHYGGGEPIEDESKFLRELGIDPDEVEAARIDNELPEFM